MAFFLPAYCAATACTSPFQTLCRSDAFATLVASSPYLSPQEQASVQSTSKRILFHSREPRQRLLNAAKDSVNFHREFLTASLVQLETAFDRQEARFCRSVQNAGAVGVCRNIGEALECQQSLGIGATALHGANESDRAARTLTMRSALAELQSIAAIWRAYRDNLGEIVTPETIACAAERTSRLTAVAAPVTSAAEDGTDNGTGHRRSALRATPGREVVRSNSVDELLCDGWNDCAVGIIPSADEIVSGMQRSLSSQRRLPPLRRSLSAAGSAMDTAFCWVRGRRRGESALQARIRKWSHSWRKKADTSFLREPRRVRLPAAGAAPNAETPPAPLVDSRDGDSIAQRARARDAWLRQEWVRRAERRDGEAGVGPAGAAEAGEGGEGGV